LLTLKIKDDYVVTIYTNGDKYWHQNGEYHRLDGPAVDCADGYKAWYQNGELQVASPELQ